MRWRADNRLFIVIWSSGVIGGAKKIYFLTGKEKRAHLAMDPLYLVRLAGIEPTTPWFVAKYSIQLSYSREKQNYSTTFS